MYHTQEKRATKLTAPIICSHSTAWLGDGYYFWYYALDAQLWGQSSKQATGAFEVYSAEIDCENVLDTVFNEEHYQFWETIISKIGNQFLSKTKKKPNLKQLNAYVREKAGWATLASVDGILFQDLTSDTRRLWIDGLAHKKRIQLAAYNPHIIKNFSFHKEETCR